MEEPLGLRLRVAGGGEVWKKPRGLGRPTGNISGFGGWGAPVVPSLSDEWGNVWHTAEDQLGPKNQKALPRSRLC